MPSCCSHHAEDDCDAELVDTEEFDNNYVSLSELKEHSLVARYPKFISSYLDILFFCLKTLVGHLQYNQFGY